MTECMVWLQDMCDKVNALEARGRKLLESGDREGYLTVMREKAELLAGLETSGAPHLACLPGRLREKTRDGLRRFASSAENALSINSVFYMSALLYPEDYKEGEPNDLERFRDELRAALQG